MSKVLSDNFLGVDAYFGQISSYSAKNAAILNFEFEHLLNFRTNFPPRYSTVIQKITSKPSSTSFDKFVKNVLIFASFE